MTVEVLVDRLGTVFATFDERTQDSGHVSHGVEAPDGTRSFVKTAGRAAASPDGTTHAERVAVLRRAASVQQEVDHPALVPLLSVLEATDGVVVTYAWFDGELLRSPAERRTHPAEAHVRFQHLPRDEVVAALDSVIDLHVLLERHGWIAGDFYDGCLMYDFDSKEVRVIDLEAYHRGPFTNEVGRLPGSTRFMAPEEHTLGAVVDARTTVLNLARMVEIFLLPRHRTPALERLVASATSPDAVRRPASVADLQAGWRAATG